MGGIETHVSLPKTLIVERYSRRNGLVLFYRNRVLRLYPVYCVVLVLSMVFALGSNTGFVHMTGEKYCQLFEQMGIFAKAYVIFVNTFIFLQDSALFLFLNETEYPVSLYFTMDFHRHLYPLYKFLVVPQAWSIGVELWFYIAAPALVTMRLPNLVAVFAGLFLLRLVGYAFGLGYDPFTYRFIPFELASFCLGAIAYRIGKYLPQNLSAGRFIIVVVCLVLATYQAWVPELIKLAPIDLQTALNEAIMIGCMAAALPAVHAATATSYFDRWIGRISYPLYIGHHFIRGLLVYMFGTQGLGGWKSVMIAMTALVFAILLERLVDDPIEKLRRKGLS